MQIVAPLDINFHFAAFAVDEKTVTHMSTLLSGSKASDDLLILSLQLYFQHLALPALMSLISSVAVHDRLLSIEHD